MANDSGPDPGDAEGMARILERNIEAILARQAAEERGQGRQEKIAAAITRFTGSMTFVYLHLLAFGIWVVISQGWTPLRPFDPTLVKLATFASVEAIFLSTFVLITQNRMQARAEEHKDLELQIALLSEHEITRLLTLVRAICQRMNIGEAHDGELNELSQDVQPEVVMDRIETIKKAFDHHEPGGHRRPPGER